LRAYGLEEQHRPAQAWLREDKGEEKKRGRISQVVGLTVFFFLSLHGTCLSARILVYIDIK
jgi:hypothetical protein